MGVENDIVFDDMIRQLDWYGHVNRMTDEGLPKKMLDWNPESYETVGQDIGEIEQEGPCYGKRCTANEHCCPGSVCVDVDGVVGSCLFAYGLRQGELCRRDNDCETGLLCTDTGEGRSCQPPASSGKQYNEFCSLSSECDIHKGLCCQFQRRHRQAPRKVCSYFKDPLICIGPVASDHIKFADIEHTSGEKRLTAKTTDSFAHLTR
ncbi:unnamed protein product [Bemisia tabaci]|uniref:Prohormone-3 n=1 Tax=Bemisia tabaci TaxID=7038 RepID=A0A9P0F940_BEMTA|nr:unnamed protein product [Bemisia tabaci]